PADFFGEKRVPLALGHLLGIRRRREKSLGERLGELVRDDRVAAEGVADERVAAIAAGVPGDFARFPAAFRGHGFASMFGRKQSPCRVVARADGRCVNASMLTSWGPSASVGKPRAARTRAPANP